MNILKKIDEYENNVNNYIKNNGKDDLGNEINFKSFGAPSGVYQQRKSDKFMVRPRTTGGIFSLEVFENLYKIRKKYKGSNIRLSSRQDFQFHNITLEDTVKLMRELYKSGLYTIGTGGNTARNVAASPLSGLYEEEEFDITEYAKEAGKFLSEDETNLNLPRKYKVAFSSTKNDTGSVSFADLGFFAINCNGVRKFNVVGAGGLGPKPRVSIELAKEIAAEDVLYYIDAMKQFFYNEGDRENRGKARIRHMLSKYGEAEFKERFNFYLQESFRKDLKILVEEKLHEAGIESFEQNLSEQDPKDRKEIKSHFIEKTNIDGIYAVKVAPIGGWLEIELHHELIEFLNELSYEVDMRLTPSQEILFRNIYDNDVEGLRRILEKEVIDSDFLNSVSCVGSSICRTGICESSETLKEITKEINKLPEEIRRQSFRIHISGCPSSCGQHQINPISFSGRLINTGDNREQGFTLFLGGKLKDSKGPASIGVAKGNVLRRDLPNFIRELIVLKYESRIEDLKEFTEKKENEILEILKKYSPS